MHSVADRACTQPVSVVKTFPIAIGSKNSWRNYLNSALLVEVLVSFVVWPWLAGNETPGERRAAIVDRQPKRNAKDLSLPRHEGQMDLDLTPCLCLKAILQHLPNCRLKSKPGSVIALRPLRQFARF